VNGVKEEGVVGGVLGGRKKGERREKEGMREWKENGRRERRGE
jgi:hypothetical protein